MRKPRICLIIDNPMRDLDGMVLLGWTLAQKASEVFLVPMYQQASEVAALLPDMVLVNYSRVNNQKLLKAYSQCGILVGVLDTEGGIFNNIEVSLTKPVAQSNPSNVDLYCLWGRRQYDSFVENNILPKEKLHITGCPRYDFCVEPWRSALACVKTDDRPMILINTRFPLIFPRFQRNLEDEMNVMIKSGHEESYVGESVRQYYLVWSEMVNVVADLAKSFSNAVFVIRPHPFEDKMIYKQVFRDLPNIRIIQEKTVLPWIRSCQILIQKCCSTALEASLLGVQPVSLDWINAPMFQNEVIDAVSYSVENKKALFDIVQNALNGNPPNATPEIERQKNRLVNEWFHAIDGKSSERVAETILKTIEQADRNKIKRKASKIMMYNGLTKAGLRNMAAFTGTRILGFRRYDKLKSCLFRKPRTISKEFGLEEIKSIIERLSRVVDNSKVVTARKVANKDCRLKMIAHCSIRLAILDAA